jgi:hypothetical protein
LKSRKVRRIDDSVLQCFITELGVDRRIAREIAAAFAKTEQFTLLPNELDVSLFTIVDKRKYKWESAFVVDPSD